MPTQKVISLAATLRGKANNVLKDKLRAGGFAKIDPSYGAILAQLFNHGDRTMMQLAEATQRDKSTVTTLVGRLEKLGHVKRRQNPNDGRSWFVCLTPKGETLRKPFWSISQELLDQAYADFTEKEKVILVRLLEKMNNNL